jgi:hypothetical protein
MLPSFSCDDSTFSTVFKVWVEERGCQTAAILLLLRGPRESITNVILERSESDCNFVCGTG